jgi:hypothetical protein
MGVMRFKGTKHNSLRLVELPLGKARRAVYGRLVDPGTGDVYEIRPREDVDGFGLVGGAFLRFNWTVSEIDLALVFMVSNAVSVDTSERGFVL